MTRRRLAFGYFLAGFAITAAIVAFVGVALTLAQLLGLLAGSPA